MAFWYSVRLSRRNVSVRPGSGLSAAAVKRRRASRRARRTRARGPNLPLRRHLPRVELPQGLLPGPEIPAHLLRTDGIKGQPRRRIVAVMARDAVQVHEPTDGFPLVRDSRRGRRPGLLPGGAELMGPTTARSRIDIPRRLCVPHRFMRLSPEINERRAKSSRMAVASRAEPDPRWRGASAGVPVASRHASLDSTVPTSGIHPSNAPRSSRLPGMKVLKLTGTLWDTDSDG